MRNGGPVVIVENQKIGLIKRVRGKSVYYVFPGGGKIPTAHFLTIFIVNEG